MKCLVTGKTQYTTEEGANKARIWIWSHDPHADLQDLHIYKCDNCEFLHIGHKSYFEGKQLQEKLQNANRTCISD